MTDSKLHSFLSPVNIFETANNHRASSFFPVGLIIVDVRLKLSMTQNSALITTIYMIRLLQGQQKCCLRNAAGKRVPLISPWMFHWLIFMFYYYFKTIWMTPTPHGGSLLSWTDYFSFSKRSDPPLNHSKKDPGSLPSQPDRTLWERRTRFRCGCRKIPALFV